VELFDQVAKLAILFGLERRRREQAHQMFLEPVRGFFRRLD